MRKNAYPGACTICGAPVAVGAGALVGNPYKLHCLPCSGEVEVPPNIQVSREPDGEILFAPSAHLGDRFGAYVEALKAGGAVYDGRLNRAPLDRALNCISRLDKAGFLLQVHTEVSASLQAFVRTQKDAITSASARASKIDVVLQERGLALFPFQRIGIQWMAPRTRALLADDMGLGKTIQALIAIPEGAAVLVVGPENGIGVWGDETPKWRPDLTFSVVDRRTFHWPAPGEMIYCTYDSLPDVGEFHRFGKMGEGTCVIADEAHKLKNAKTKRTLRFREISQQARTSLGRVWLLTGTPLLNRPPELWALLQAAELANEAFGSYWKFVKAFNGQRDHWGKIVWGEAQPGVGDQLRKVMLRREKSQVLTDLPEKSYRIQHVAIDARWDRELSRCIDQLNKHIPSVYDLLRYDWLNAEEGALRPGQTHPNPIINSGQIKAARETILGASGGSFPEMSHAREQLALAKIPAMLNCIEEFEEQGEPVVVFSAHRGPIDTLSQREGWAVITGDIGGEERQRIARDFQDGKYKGIGLTIEAGGTAMTLTRASQVVFVDRSFTPKLNEQAEDRLVRIGQTRGVVVTVLVAEHFLDKRLAEILNLKSRIIRSSVDAASVSQNVNSDALPGVTEVDFDKLAVTAEESLKGAYEAKAEAKRIAAERAQNAAELRAKLAKETEERKIREKGLKRYEAARQRAVERGWVEAADHPDRRAPADPIEEWAATGLATLSGLDPDRATSRNDVGFSKSDSYLGHWLTVEIGRGLTPNQWALAINLCRSYHRQIGRCPEVTTG